MVLKSNNKSSDSHSGLELVFNELKQIKTLIRRAKNSLVREVPVVGYIMRENDQHLTDLIFNDKTLTVRFYQTYKDKADKSYILFAVVDGCIDNDGEPMPSNPGRIGEIGRYDFYGVKDGEILWSNQDDDQEIYSSIELTELWLEKFRIEALKDLELSDIFQYRLRYN